MNSSWILHELHRSLSNVIWLGVLNDAIRSVRPALVHPGMARPYALQRDMAGRRATYQDFLTWWEDADPDSYIAGGQGRIPRAAD